MSDAKPTAAEQINLLLAHLQYQLPLPTPLQLPEGNPLELEALGGTPPLNRHNTVRFDAHQMFAESITVYVEDGEMIDQDYEEIDPEILAQDILTLIAAYAAHLRYRTVHEKSNS